MLFSIISYLLYHELYNIKTNLEAVLLDRCPLFMAIATISLLITSGGKRSIASNNVSNQALATTGSLLSIDVRIPLRNVLVKEGVAVVPPTKVAEVVEGVG